MAFSFVECKKNQQFLILLVWCENMAGSHLGLLLSAASGRKLNVASRRNIPGMAARSNTLPRNLGSRQPVYTNGSNNSAAAKHKPYSTPPPIKRQLSVSIFSYCSIKNYSRIATPFRICFFCVNYALIWVNSKCLELAPGVPLCTGNCTLYKSI